MPNASAPAQSGLRVFRDPSSVAVVGASDDPTKWGHWLARGALSGVGRRDVYLVNAAARPVLGVETYPALRQLPRVPELVALCVPARHIAAVVDEALSLGVRGFLGITAGVREEKTIAAQITAAGARLIGMNSLGLFDAETALHLAWGNFVAGSIAVVSQSGQLGSEIANLAARAGLGISRFVSVGSQTDVGAVEVLADLADDPSTTLVAVYLESFSNGRALTAALTALREAGKYVLLLTVGASAASSRLARSHTGAMTSSIDIVDAVARASGAVRVLTPVELIDVAKLVVSGNAPSGNRVAIVGDSGGQTGIAADVAAHVGLSVPEVSSRLQQRVGALLPEAAATANPVDLAGGGEQDLATYARVAELLLGADDVDAVVLTGYFGSYGVDAPSLVAAEVSVASLLGEAARASGKRLVVHSMNSDNPATDTLNTLTVPVYQSIDAAMCALGYGHRFSHAPRSLPTISSEAQPAVEPGYPAAKEILSRIGIPFPPGRVVRSIEEVSAAASRLSAPYVLKASWLEHKSEVGGVRIGLRSAEAVTDAFAEMSARLGEGDYVIEELDVRPDVVEILVGARVDPDLGTVVVVGAGGTEAEIYRDVAIELAPVDLATAMAMLNRLTCKALLDGWRGRPAVDIPALATVVVAVSEMALAARSIAEVEINPVRVSPTGVLAVDALIIPANDVSGHS